MDHNIASALNRSDEIGVPVLDISQVSGGVSHSKLLVKLESMGVPITLLSLFRTYPLNRKQWVERWFLRNTRCKLRRLSGKCACAANLCECHVSVVEERVNVMLRVDDCVICVTYYVCMIPSAELLHFLV